MAAANLNPLGTPERLQAPILFLELAKTFRALFVKRFPHSFIEFHQTLLHRLEWHIY